MSSYGVLADHLETCLSELERHDCVRDGIRLLLLDDCHEEYVGPRRPFDCRNKVYLGQPQATVRNESVQFVKLLAVVLFDLDRFYEETTHR